MRASAVVFSLLLLSGTATAQDYGRGESDNGVTLDMGRGLDNGVSVGFRFKEHWTIRPTIGLAYRAQTGLQANLGSTVLRSFGLGSRVYGYVGAGVHYGTANAGTTMTPNGPVQTGRGGNVTQANAAFAQALNSSLLYATAPVGLRARVFRNIEAIRRGRVPAHAVGRVRAESARTDLRRRAAAVRRDDRAEPRPSVVRPS